MAEFSHWYEITSGRYYKWSINEWQWRLYVGWLAERLAATYGHFGANAGARHSVDKDILLLSYVLLQAVNDKGVTGFGGDPASSEIDLQEFDPAVVRQGIQDFWYRKDPIEFLPFLHSRLTAFATLVKLREVFEANRTNAHCNFKNHFAWHEALASVMDAERLALAQSADQVSLDVTSGFHPLWPALGVMCKTTSIRLVEILADIGMWCGLAAIARRYSKRAATTATKSGDLERVFVSILETLFTSTPPSAGLAAPIEAVLLRWAVLYRALNRNEKNWRVAFFRKAIQAWSDANPTRGSLPITEAEFNHAVDRMALDYCFFEAGNGQRPVAGETLVQILQRFSEFGGTGTPRADIILPVEGSQEDSLLLSFYALWNSARTDASGVDNHRLKFVAELWAKAQRFCVTNAFAYTNSDGSPFGG